MRTILDHASGAVIGAVATLVTLQVSASGPVALYAVPMERVASALLLFGLVVVAFQYNARKHQKRSSNE